MKSYNEPTPEEVTTAARYFVHPQAASRFFEGLNNPRWIIPLVDRGVFDRPPEPVFDEAKQSYRVFAWPALLYLVRVIGEGTDNEQNRVVSKLIAIDAPDIFVREQISEIGLIVRLELAEQIAKSQQQWVNQLQHLEFGSQSAVTKLAHRLIVEGKEMAGRDLFWVIVGISKDLRESFSDEQLQYRTKLGASLRLDEFDYARLMRSSVEILLKLGIGAFKRCCNELDEALTIEDGSDRRESGQDYSETWRERIDKDDLEPAWSVTSTLVTVVRDLCLAAGNDPDVFRSYIAELDRHPWKVFQRIALFVLSKTDVLSLEELARRVEIESVLSNDVFPEHWDLIASKWHSWQPEYRGDILGRIEAGPDVEAIRRLMERRGESVTEAPLINHANAWRARFLDYIEPSLSEAERQQVSKWQEAVNARREYLRRMPPAGRAFFVGSPVSADELLAMDDDQAFEMVRNWRPQSDEYWLGRDALGDAWSNAVKRAPERFASLGAKLGGLPADLQWRTLSGFREAIQAGASVDFVSLLPLLSRAVDDAFMPEADSEAIRSAIDVLEVSLRSGQEFAPVKQAAAVWNLIARCLQHSSPTPEYERTYGGKNMDPLTLSINCVRSDALHAALEYLIWLNPNVAETGRAMTVPDDIVRALDEHLDPSKDPSLAVRAVYGKWLPWLHAYLPDWTIANLDRIFPSDLTLRPWLTAAWETYITYSGYFTNTYRVLKPVYQRVIELMPDDVIGATTILGRHVHFGLILGEDEVGLGGPVDAFYQRAPDKVREDSLQQLGYDISADHFLPNDDQKQRLINLWNWRAEEMRLGRASSGEAHAYGAWFSSGKLPDEWSLIRLSQSIRTAKGTDRSPEVLGRLSALTAIYPMLVLDAFEAFFEHVAYRWVTSLWKQNIVQIIKSLRNLAPPEAKDRIEVIANGYARSGLLRPEDFKD